MKYCVTCQKSNLGRKFIDGQCETCFSLNPIPQVVYIRPEKRCEICDKPMKSVCLYCKRSKEEVERILNPKPIVIKVKKAKKPKKHFCKLCGFEETPNNPFKDRPKPNCKYFHIKCLEYRDNMKKPLEKKKSGKPITTMLERLSYLPDFKICNTCQEEKHINKFYIRNGYAAARCKQCHGKITRKWAVDHEEEVRKYNKIYHKTYKRKKK